MEKGIDPMPVNSIIWDFDGTLLPNDPNDSEQSLMLSKLKAANTDISAMMRATARLMIYADSREKLRRTFKRFYVSFMKGTHIKTLDEVSEQLAKKILPADRQAIVELKKQGYTMIVLSCGTADLSERVLKMAGLTHCFDLIAGNRFTFKNGCISGMTYEMNNPDDKRSFLQKSAFTPENCIAIGDGYTDIPMLDWAAEAIVLDREGHKKAQFQHKNYHFISSIPGVLELIRTVNEI